MLANVRFRGKAAAAAMAIPGVSSWVALKERAGFTAGETVLVNGATGTSGRLAVRIAKYLAAKKVIATGRQAATLQLIKALGADETILLIENRDALENTLKEQFAGGADVVLDYLWGQSAECLLIAGSRAGADAPIRFVQIGTRWWGEYHLARSDTAFNRNRAKGKWAR